MNASDGAFLANENVSVNDFDCALDDGDDGGDGGAKDGASVSTTGSANVSRWNRMKKMCETKIARTIVIVLVSSHVVRLAHGVGPLVCVPVSVLLSFGWSNSNSNSNSAQPLDRRSKLPSLPYRTELYE